MGERKRERERETTKLEELVAEKGNKFFDDQNFSNKKISQANFLKQ